ncbi:MAG: GldG family protein [Byssovorax sp.]
MSDPPEKSAANANAKPEPIPTGTTAGTKLSASLGVVAAMVLALLLNVLASRHYRRWDWTRGGLYTLSDATTQTLHGLEEPIHVYVLLSEGDPLALAVRHLLEAYRGETTRLVVDFVDPDRRAAEFIAVQQRFGIVAGKTDDGKIVTDAAIVVARGDVPHFITTRDLVQTDEDDELRRRPRIEQALTSAIRAVISNERPRACFTVGHGEGAIAPGAGAGAGGLGPFRESLIKNNFEVVDVAADEPLAACRVVVIAGPTEKTTVDELKRYVAYADQGGSLLVALGPELDAERGRAKNRGLAELLARFGVASSDDFVFELDPRLRMAQGYGESFIAQARTHPVTEGLLKVADRGVAVVLTLGSSLTATGAGAAAPTPLLVTSDQAFGMIDFFTWSKARTPPVPGPADRKGPLTMAFASELPKPPGSSLPHGGRLVVIGSASVLWGANWQAEELRGGSLFVGSAVAWLTARPQLLDIPEKPTFTAGLHVSDAWLASTFRYVVVYIPLASVLLGLAVYLRRRGTERRGPSDDPAKAPIEPERKVAKKTKKSLK